MSTIIKSVLSILFISQTIQARSFNPCELENELLNNYNLTTDESRNLTCVAQKYSQLTTNIINNGSKTVYYGIFQIGQKYCGTDKVGGKCNIKCSNLVDDDLTDDIKCAQKVFQKLGPKAWKLNKSPGCKKEFNYLDETCHKNANIDDTFQVQPDFCELARKLMTEYDISKIDATIWSCISDYSKTGNLNLRVAEEEDENRRNDEESCVKARDVECAIKNNKLSDFTNWPAYELYCKNITESTCFQGTNSVNTTDIIEQIKTVQNAETSKQPKIFTTSTEVSVFIEDDDGNLTEYSDITTESPKVSQQTTEFLSDTLEEPSFNDKPTIEGYSKVRVMSADKKIVEYPETRVTTSKSVDEITLINSSLAKSTTDSISAELSHTKHTTEEIEVKYYETVDKCALAKSMNDSGRFPQNLISTFLCIAEHESGLNVSLIDSDGQQSRYGLFQIDNQIYCSNQCHVLCTQLVDDQFDNDFECVRHIYKKEGFNYWPSYEKSCKNINSNSLDYCFETFTTSQRPSTILYIEDTVGTTEATINDLSHMEMTTLINDPELASSDGSLDFCEFSHQLKVNLSIENFEDFVHYVCIADQISHLRPKLLNDDRLGIFSLKDNTCGKYEAGGLCSILCSNLLNDDLIDDAECMVKVYKEFGLKEWNIDINSCKAYTPKIIRCIDEDKFPIPSVDESDDTGDQTIEPDSKEDEIQKHVADNLEMTLSRANAVNETVESLEDFNKSYQTTLPSTEANAFKDETTVEPDIFTTTKVVKQDEESLENEDQTTTEVQKSFDTTEKYLEEEEPVVAMKSLLDTDSSDELESETTTSEPKNDESDQTTSIKYDDDNINENKEQDTVEINLLTTTIESLLDTEIEGNDSEDNEPETTDKIEEETQEPFTNLEMDDETERTVTIDEMDETSISVNKAEETTIKDLEKNQNEKDEIFENEPEIISTIEEEESPEVTTKSLLQIEDEDFKALINDITKTLIHKITQDKNHAKSENKTLTLVDPVTEDYETVETETDKLKSSQTTEGYDVIDYDIVPKNWQTGILAENDEKSVQEETTSEIPLNFDDKTEIVESEILGSENFSEDTEKSTVEETTANVESISDESSLSQSDSHTENIEKFIEQETTTENEAYKHIEDQIYLKSTTESSFTKNILDTTETTQELMTKLNEDINDQSTESDELNEAEPEESTIATALLDEESDFTVTTEEPIPKPTTENLYYTSIREIIEEYQKSSVKYLDNVQTKRNPDFLDDYDDFVDDQGSTKQFIDSLNQFTTLPVTPHSVNIPNSQRINKCELARYMNSSGFPENLIPTLICIAEHESELNPHAVKISKSHNKYGLFQIDDNIYCSTDEKITECEISCELLTDSQYDNDFECVRHIYKKEGFNYWPSYEKSCKNVAWDSLDHCYDDFKSESDENEELLKFQQTTLEMSQIEDIPVTTDSQTFNLKDNESKSIVRKFDLCELARELYSRNISMNDIPQYLCIADIKSQLEIKIPNVNEQSYGLFSINSDFCGQNESGGICSMKCSELWDSDISDDVDCVYKIIQTNGTDKWNLNSEACQIYDNKILECFDKTTEHPKIDFVDVERNASVFQHDVIVDKNLEDLRQEITNLRSSNFDIESDEMTTEETAIPTEQTTSKIIQILTSTAASNNDDLSTIEKQTRRVPIVNINLPRDLLTDQNLSKQVNTLIKNFTYYDVLPKNGSIIFNIFNFNIYGEDHDIKFTVNRGTELRDETDD